MRKISRESYVPYLLIAPAMAFLFLFTVWPLLRQVYLSFFSYNLVNPDMKFVGFKNYKELLFVKKDFLQAMVNTLVFSFSHLFLVLILAMALALWLFREKRVDRIARTAIFTPHIIAMVSCAMVWSWLMDVDKGLFNQILHVFRLPGLRWLNSSQTAMISVVIVSVWKSTGYYMLILAAALNAIPSEIYEAADLDNTGVWRKFAKITLPMISPQILFLLIMITINSFQVFDAVRILTDGGPGNATDVLAYYIYRQAFSNFKIGYASAAGTIFMLIISALTALYFKGLSNKVHYQ